MITSTRSIVFAALFGCIAVLCGCQNASQAPVPALAQPADPKVFLSFHAADDLAPDADADSAFWKGIPGVIMDKSVLGPEMPQFRAEIRSRWTEQNLYFLFIGHYETLTLNEHPKTDVETPRLWLKDVFELYIGSDYEHTNRYRELQMSPQGEFLDNDIDSTRNRPGFNGEDAWNSGFKVRSRIDEKSKIWCGEMQIPFAAIDARPPKAGSELRINMYRQDGTGRSRDFLAWQPPGVWNPHHPEVFGTLRLANGR